MATLRVGLTVGAHVGSTTEAISWDLSTNLLLQWPVNIAGRGSSMTVRGMGIAMFDTSVGVRGGGTSCEATDWISETILRCRTSSGVTGTMRVGVTVGIQLGSLTEVLSYDKSLSTVHPANRASTGSTSVTV
eukprot:3514484-Rhodomonas_salina.1